MAEQSRPQPSGMPVQNSNIDDPYAGHHQRGVPSNPAWRYCPEFARTPSPKSMPGVWPPRPLRWPAMTMGDGFFPLLGSVVSRVPVSVMNRLMAPYDAPLPVQNEVLAQPDDDKFTTPPRRKIVNSPRMLLSPSSRATSANSSMSLGKSGYRADSANNVTEGMPFITPERSVASSSTENDKLQDVLSSQDSDKTTINMDALTPDGKSVKTKGVKRKHCLGRGPDDDASKSPAASEIIRVVAHSSTSASSSAPPMMPSKIDMTCQLSVSVENRQKMRRER